MSARKPVKPKIRKVDFHETLTPVVPYSPAAPSIGAVRYGVPDRYLHAGLYLIWILAAIFAGVGIGLLMLGKMRVLPVEAPKPVASAAIKVATVAAPALVRVGLSTESTPLTSAMSSGSIVQAASDSNSLQPGFVPYGSAQGKRGTAPVSQ
jgi:hypothetical protein